MKTRTNALSRTVTLPALKLNVFLLAFMCLSLLIALPVSGQGQLLANSEAADKNRLSASVPYSAKAQTLTQWLDLIARHTHTDYSFNPAAIDGNRREALPEYRNAEELVKILAQRYGFTYALKGGRHLLLKPEKREKKDKPSVSMFFGTVHEQGSGRAVAGAHIYLTSLRQDIRTDSSGHFGATLPYPSIHTDMLVASEGYKPIRRRVKIEGRSFVSVEAERDLDLPVTASLKQVPAVIPAPDTIAKPAPDTVAAMPAKPAVPAPYAWQPPAKADTSKPAPSRDRVSVGKQDKPGNSEPNIGKMLGFKLPVANSLLNFFPSSGVSAPHPENDSPFDTSKSPSLDLSAINRFFIDTGIQSYKPVPFSGSIFPHISGGHMHHTGLVPSFSLNFPIGYNAGLNGLELGLLMNFERGNMQGVQAATIGNVVFGEVSGVSVASVFNYSGLNMRGLQVATLGNLASADVQGLQVASIANIARGNVRGIQATAIANYAEANMTGLQVSGISNYALSLNGIQVCGASNVSGGKGAGLQIAGFSNVLAHNPDTLFNSITGYGFKRLNMEMFFPVKPGERVVSQIAGLTNFSAYPIRGVQIAGAANFSRGIAGGLSIAVGTNQSGNVKGTQIAVFNKADTVYGLQLGVVNIARSVKGTQIGVVNLCDSSTGVPIGLVNLGRNSSFTELGASYSVYRMFEFSLRHYSRSFHWIYNFNYAPESPNKDWYCGIGPGGLIPLGKGKNSSEISLSLVYNTPMRDINKYEGWVAFSPGVNLNLGSGFRLRAEAEGSVFINQPGIIPRQMGQGGFLSQKLSPRVHLAESFKAGAYYRF
ncbi:MAG: hypothetical protein V4543_14235 [Bacteroidota bacterium]